MSPGWRSGGGLCGSATRQGIANWKLIVSMREGVVLRDRALIEMIDFPMPQKTHTENAAKRPPSLRCARSFNDPQLHLALLPSARMLDEKFPHHAAGADLTGRAPKDPFRQGLATRPAMTSSLDGVENHVRILSAVRVRKAPNLRRNSSVAPIAFALVSRRHAGRPIRNTWKQSGRNRRFPAQKRGNLVGSAVEGYGRYRLGIPAFLQGSGERARDDPHGRDPVGKLARQQESHTSAVGHPIGINAACIDAVVSLELINQVGNESDVLWQTVRPRWPNTCTPRISTQKGATSQPDRRQ